MSENKISPEEQMLIDAEAKGTGAKFKTYVKLSGPGWLQSAITLGGGSLATALFLGVIGGTQFLWIQLLAMIMGVIMLSAISYVTLSSGKSPYKMIRDDINPVLAWGWLVASLMANMIWVMPQYALSYDALTNNLGLSFGSENANKYVITAVVFIFCTVMVMTYGKGGKGQKIFDLATKLVVAGIVVTFMAVAFKILFVDKSISIGQVFSGFIPNPGNFSEPVGAVAEQLNKLNPEVQSFWKSQAMSMQVTILISAAAFAVGVNMTFMMPFSLISRGWNKNFRGLATFDLSTGMLIPFVLATSCVVIASAAAFHGQSNDAIAPVAKVSTTIPGDKLEAVKSNWKEDGALKIVSAKETEGGYQYEMEFVSPESGKYEISKFLKLAGKDGVVSISPIEVTTVKGINSFASGDVLGGMTKSIAGRKADEKLKDVPVSQEELVMASYLIKRGTGSFTKALEGVVGKKMAHIIFGMGVLAMGLSTITMLMLISGFCVCELGGYEHGGKQHKLGTLLGSTGLLWFVVWTGPSKPYLAAATGTIGYVFLPIAYISFWILFNSKKAMGENAAIGRSKTIWNIVMGVSTIVTCFAALGPFGAWGKGLEVPIGKTFVIAFVLFAIVGHLDMVGRRKEAEKNKNAGVPEEASASE